MNIYVTTLNINKNPKQSNIQHPQPPEPLRFPPANLVHNPNPAKKQQVPLQCLWDVPPYRSNSSPTNHETAKASEIISSSPGPEWLYTIPAGTATIFFLRFDQLVVAKNNPKSAVFMVSITLNTEIGPKQHLKKHPN